MFRNSNSQRIIESLITNIIQEGIHEEESQGLSEETIAELRNQSYQYTTSDNIQQCSICLENFSENNNVISLPCEHIFHLDCIERWGQSHNSCPLCRNAIEQQQIHHRIIVNTNYSLQIVFHFNDVMINTFWNSTDTIVSLFEYLQRMYNRHRRLLIQINNKVFKTTESYEILSQSLSYHGITDLAHAHVHFF